MALMAEMKTSSRAGTNLQSLTDVHRRFSRKHLIITGHIHPWINCVMFKVYLQPSPKLLQVDLCPINFDLGSNERASAVENFRFLLMCFSLFFVGVHQQDPYLHFLERFKSPGDPELLLRSDGLSSCPRFRWQRYVL